MNPELTRRDAGRISARNMPSPSGIAVGIFTLAEIIAMRRELILTGTINSVSGAAKSGQFGRLDPMQQGIELKFAQAQLQGTATVNRVEQNIFPNG